MNDSDFRRAEEALWSEVKRHNHTIYGNGSEGLTTRLSLTEQAVREIRDMMRARRNSERAILLLMLGLVLRDLWQTLGHSL